MYLKNLKKLGYFSIIFAILSSLLSFLPNVKADDYLPENNLGDSNVEFVSSQIGGSFEAIFVQDHRAYLGIGKNLVILNIENPRNHFVEGTLNNFPNTIASIFVDQTKAYITDRDRLWIVNIENQSQPEILGYFKPSEGCGGVSARGNKVFALCRTTLYSVDVSDPAHPTVSGYVVIPDSGAWIDSIKIDGDYAYIPNNVEGLYIIDISDQTALRVVGVGSGESYGRLNDVFISSRNNRTLAYMVSPEKGVFSADVTDPENIQLFGNLASTDWPAQLYVKDNYAYVANQGGGLWIINMINLDHPVTASILKTDGMAFHVFLDGNLVLINSYSGGLYMIDASSPASPQEVSIYEEPVWINRVMVKENVAYTVGEKGLGMYDVKNPYNLKFLGMFKTKNTGGIEVVGDRVYLGGAPGKFEVVDVKNPKVPELVGEFQITENVNPVPACDPPPPDLPNQPYIPSVIDISVEGQYAYLANSGAGLRVLNISDSTNITEEGVYKNPNWINISSILKVNNLAYILDEGCWNLDGGLWVISLSDLANPSVIGFLPLPKWGKDLEVQGNYAYVAMSTNGFYVVNLENPVEPRIVGTIDGQTEDVFINGNLAYLASGSDGLRVADISDPTNPIVLGSYTLDGAFGVYHQGCVSYLAQWGYGMTLVGYQGDGENCTVSGHVKDSQGSPLSGIELTIHPSQSTSALGSITAASFSVTTDQYGNYTIAGLTTNQYDLAPSLQGKVFYPTKRQIKVATDIAEQNFIAIDKNSFFLPFIRK